MPAADVSDASEPAVDASESAAAGSHALLGPADIRRLADTLGLRPTKKLGQNFVHDANTVRRIVAAAELRADDVVLEVGPGLGSLTCALLPAVARVHAVEVDGTLADQLPRTVAERMPGHTQRLSVHHADALRLRAADLDPAPSALVANLPYNVAVPIVLHALAELPRLRTVLVMVQAEVADRMAAAPGGRVYGIPSVKLAWYGRARRAGSIGRRVFWPEPNVDSALVRLDRSDVPWPGHRDEVFSLVEAAFAQRRKMVRGAIAGWLGDDPAAVLAAAGVDPTTRAEQLGLADFVRIAQAASA